jgi:hypothetical protein
VLWQRLCLGPQSRKHFRVGSDRRGQELYRFGSGPKSLSRWPLGSLSASCRLASGVGLSPSGWQLAYPGHASHRPRRSHCGRKESQRCRRPSSSFRASIRACLLPIPSWPNCRPRTTFRDQNRVEACSLSTSQGENRTNAQVSQHTAGVPSSHRRIVSRLIFSFRCSKLGRATRSQSMNAPSQRSA